MNWGTKLTIGMVLFMGFIISLVILMIKPNKADSLIENDYYEKGQTFDLDYNASRSAINDNMIPVIKAGGKDIWITFPKPVKYEILLRRLADSSMDKTFKSDSIQTEAFISNGDLKPGSWLIRIQYKSGQKDYLYQNKILLK